jgi:hypothetical protein
MTPHDIWMDVIEQSRQASRYDEYVIENAERPKYESRQDIDRRQDVCDTGDRDAFVYDVHAAVAHQSHQQDREIRQQ